MDQTDIRVSVYTHCWDKFCVHLGHRLHNIKMRELKTELRVVLYHDLGGPTHAALASLVTPLYRSFEK
jgi:hypothetical protein